MNPEVKTPKYVIERAHELRMDMTFTEKLLWEKIKNKQVDGFRFRRQHPVYRYILDFYCAEKSLTIEIDGVVHGKSKEYDKYRDKLLESLCIQTLRIKDKEILTDIDKVVRKIKEKLNS